MCLFHEQPELKQQCVERITQRRAEPVTHAALEALTEKLGLCQNLVDILVWVIQVHAVVLSLLKISHLLHLP